jgi:adenosylhomocysteine nucleosidase
MRFKKIAALSVAFLSLARFSANADTIAFFYALDKDFEMLKIEAQSTWQSIKVGSRTIPVLLLNSHRVYAVKMGSGGVETAISAQALLARIHCDEGFSVGPVGGLSDELKVGDWYQVREIVAYQKGSWTKTGFQLSENALRKLTNALPQNRSELFQKLDNIKVASGEIFVASDNYRAQLRETTDADAVDMNLFGLVRVCADYQLPLICWRVVSDHANDNASEDFKKFAADYDGSGGKAVAETIKNLPINLNSPEAYPNLRKILSQ